MKREVITYNTIEGFHCWPDADNGCAYLRERHRHIFVIRCYFGVSHNGREIEINTKQGKIDSLLKCAYGSPCEFESLSCEDIAEWLLGSMPDCDKVEVLEDGYGGAALSR